MSNDIDIMVEKELARLRLRGYEFSCEYVPWNKTYDFYGFDREGTKTYKCRNIVEGDFLDYLKELK